MRGAQIALRDQRRFEQAFRGADPEAAIPGSDLLTGLRGKDVIIAFVESYGQVAVQGTSFSPGVDAVLRQQTGLADPRRLVHAERLAHLPDFGGISRLAHSTLQSGLWVNSHQRYNELVASDRFTLSDAFNKAGWRTVADGPSDDTTGHPARPFTTTTRPTTGVMSATTARPSATPRCPTSTPWPSSSGSSSPLATSP